MPTSATVTASTAEADGGLAGLQPALQHRGTRAVQRMVEHAPSTGGLSLWVHHAEAPPPPADAAAGGPPVTTDGHTLFYAPSFDTLSLPAQAGCVAHAVLHVALRHPQRYIELQKTVGDVDLRLFNVCADAIVNTTLAHLAWLQLPTNAVQLDGLLSSALGVTQSPEAALLEWDVERLYREIDDRRPPPLGRQRNEGPRSPDRDDAPQRTGGREDGPRAQRVRALGSAASADLVPDASAVGAPEDDAEQTREWNERLVRAHAGDGARSMLRALIADLPQSRTPWEQVLRTQLARALAHRTGPSWSRPARSYIANQGRAGPTRRMPWEPGTSASRAVPRLAVLVDVSGSIAEPLMERFAREIEALTRRLEAGLVLIIGDDRVRRVEHFEPGRSALREITFTGGGGTDFTPLLDEAREHRPDIAVVLTDLQGPARTRPPCPVIWAVPEAWRHAVPPFGRLLVLR